MKTNLLKKLAVCLALTAGMSAFSFCTKEDDGLTDEARATVQKLKGDYNLKCATWTPAPATKSSVLVLIDTTEAKNIGGVSVSIEGKNGAYDKGTIKIEIPFYHFVSDFCAFFNQEIPAGVTQLPQSWVVNVAYEIDDFGKILFPEYDFDELGGYLADVYVSFDETESSIILSVTTKFSGGILEEFFDGSFINNFGSGTFQIYFRKQ